MKKIIALIIFLLIIIFVMYQFNYLPHKMYTNKDFNITSYISEVDMDNDGIDDATDILTNARLGMKHKKRMCR